MREKSESYPHGRPTGAKNFVHELGGLDAAVEPNIRDVESFLAITELGLGKN